MTSFAPEGWNTITPRIVCADPEGLLRFLKSVFGAKGNLLPSQPCIAAIGDSKIMISDTDERDIVSAFLYVYVRNADDVYRKAMEAGAISIEEPSIMQL